MASDRRMSSTAALAEASALAALADDGYIRVYTGFRPSSADRAISTQVLLAELRLGSPAFAPPVHYAEVGVNMTANAITPELSAVGAGDAVWARIFMADGITPLWDDSVGVADENIVLPVIAIGVGYQLHMDSYQHFIPIQASS